LVPDDGSELSHDIVDLLDACSDLLQGLL
jgi:hypothetical protein